MTKSLLFWLCALFVSTSAGATSCNVSGKFGCRPDDTNDSLKIIQLVKTWNDAINSNKPEQLKGLYADRVVYYLNDFSGKQCVDSKATWLSKHQEYRQKIGEIELTRVYKGSKTIIMADFEKEYSTNGKTAVASAFLEFEYAGNGWKIVTESDAASEKKRLEQTGPVTLPKGEYFFSGGLYVDTEDEQGDLTYSLSLNVGDEITGFYDFWSYITRTNFRYTITTARMENGILELSLVFEEESGSPRENEDEEEPESAFRFKIMSTEELYELDDEIPVSLFLHENVEDGK